MPTVLGIDPGTRHCGVAVVAGPLERVYWAEDIRLREGDAQARVLACKSRLRALVAQWQPQGIAIEQFAWEGHSTTGFQEMNWLVGLCLDLGHDLPIPATVRLFTVNAWRAQIVGRPLRGTAGKRTSATVVGARLGHVFRGPGYHEADAAGVALALYDQMTTRCLSSSA